MIVMPFAIYLTKRIVNSNSITYTTYHKVTDCIHTKEVRLSIYNGLQGIRNFAGLYYNTIHMIHNALTRMHTYT